MLKGAFLAFQFYFMIYLQRFWSNHFWSKKSMKELSYSPNFWDRVYQDFLDFSKKIWGLGASPRCISYEAQDPQNKAYRGSWSALGVGPPDPQFFFRSPESPNRLYPKNQVSSLTPSWIFLTQSDLTKISISIS